MKLFGDRDGNTGKEYALKNTLWGERATIKYLERPLLLGFCRAVEDRDGSPF